MMRRRRAADGAVEIGVQVRLSPKEIDVLLCVTSWRIARQRLRQQQPTLAVLFFAAQKANSEQPVLDEVAMSLQNISEKTGFAIGDYAERLGTATGTRDAYATAIVMVIDDVLKSFYRPYKCISDAPKSFAVVVNQVDLFEAFRVAGNSARHYQEWRRPTNQVLRADEAYKNISAIAKIVGRPVPERDGLSVMAANWAWPIIHAVGEGTFDGVMAKVRACMDEIVKNLGMQGDPLVLDEVAKDYPT